MATESKKDGEMFAQKGTALGLRSEKLKGYIEKVLYGESSLTVIPQSVGRITTIHKHITSHNWKTPGKLLV